MFRQPCWSWSIPGLGVPSTCRVWGPPWAARTPTGKSWPGAPFSSAPCAQCAAGRLGNAPADFVPRTRTVAELGGAPAPFTSSQFGGSLLSLVLSLNPLWGVPLESPICFSSAPGPDAGLSGLHPSIWISCVGPVSRCILVSVSELGALVWGIPGMQKMFLGLGPGVSGSIPQLSQPHIMGTVSILFWGHVSGLGARPSRSRGLSAGPHPRSTSLTC